MKIRGLMMDPVTNMPIVILKDVSGNSVLPIWVGIYEANAIGWAPRHSGHHWPLLWRTGTIWRAGANCRNASLILELSIRA